MEALPTTLSRPYLVRATDPAGRLLYSEVDATSSANARDQLLAKGFSAIDILTTEFTTLAPPSLREGAYRLSPRDQVGVSTDAGFWSARFYSLWIVYRSFGYLPPIGVIGILLCRALWVPPIWDAICAIPVVVPLLIWMRPQPSVSRLWNRAQTAYVHARFDEVLSLSAQIEASDAGALAEHYVAFVAAELRCKSLARIERLDEALSHIHAFESRAEATATQVVMLRLITYTNAKMWDEVVQCSLELDALAPENPFGLLARAECLAIWLDRAADARACLERARAMVLSEHLRQLFFPILEGQVLLSERRFVESRDRLEPILVLLRKRSRETTALKLLVALIQTHLAQACAHCGDLASARQHWRSAEPLMALHEMEPLVTQTRRVLGVSGDRLT